MNTVTVKINGVEYNLKGKEDEKYLFDVAEYVDSKIREIGGNNKKLSISSAAVLTAVNIVDELFKCDVEINDLTKKKNSLEERHLTLKERLRELKLEIEESSKAHANEIDHLKNIIFSMEEKLRENEEVKLDNENLREEISNLTKAADLDKSNIESLQKELEIIKNKNINLEESLSKCKEQLENSVNIKMYDELVSKFEKSEEANELLSSENKALNEKCKEYSIEIDNFKDENNTLLKSQEELREKINIKNIELEETKNTLIKEKSEETDLLRNKIKSLQKDLESNIKKKELFIERNKEMGFKIQNYRYKVLDLEKKLLDTQFSLAVEKKEKNPLLR